MTEDSRGEAAGHVADTAILAGRDMSWMLTDRVHPMTGVTSLAHHVGTGVIDIAPDKGRNVVAHPAIGARDNMAIRLANGTGRIMISVMAQGAIIVDACVGEGRRHK